MSDAQQRMARLIEPLRHEYPSAEQIASAMCEIHDVVNGKPGDPGIAYPLVERLRGVLQRADDNIESLQRAIKDIRSGVMPW